jgi:hypothetical protein
VGVPYPKSDQYIQGDQIGAFFANWATFGGSLEFFERMNQPKIMATFWSNFCLSKFITFLPK